MFFCCFLKICVLFHFKHYTFRSFRNYSKFDISNSAVFLCCFISECKGNTEANRIARESARTLLTDLELFCWTEKCFYKMNFWRRKNPNPKLKTPEEPPRNESFQNDPSLLRNFKFQDIGISVRTNYTYSPSFLQDTIAWRRIYWECLYCILRSVDSVEKSKKLLYTLSWSAFSF